MNSYNAHHHAQKVASGLKKGKRGKAETGGGGEEELEEEFGDLHIGSEENSEAQEQEEDDADDVTLDKMIKVGSGKKKGATKGTTKTKEKKTTAKRSTKGKK